MKDNQDRATPSGGSKDTTELERSLSPISLSLYGLGTVLGAGIYVVIGKIIGEAGLLAPVSFLFAAFAAAFTALSYVELSTRIPLSGGSAAYIDHAFRTQAFTGLVGWSIIATGLVSAATITTGFYGYLGVFVDWPKSLVVPAGVFVLTAIAAAGVKQSAWFMGLTTLAGIAGLVLVLLSAGGNMANYPAQLGDIGTVSFTGILLGSFLAFYAYIGFEDIVTLTEETRNVRRTLPIAIFVALGASTLLYLLVSATAATTLSSEALNESKAPLVDVVREAGRSGTMVGILSLAIIVNGALAQIVMVTRIAHDLGTRRGLAPGWLTKINSRTRTPLVATLLAGTIVLLLALFLPLETLASTTSFIILGVFAAVNAALLRLKQKGEKPDHPYKSYPVFVPVGGLLVSILLLLAEILFGGGGGG